MEDTSLPANRPGPVRLLDVELDLADVVGPPELGAATRDSLVDTVVLSRGRWGDAGEFAGVPLFLISGLLLGRRSLGDHGSVELVEAGSLFTTDSRSSSPLELDWKVIEQAWVAVLDRDFWEAVAPYPQIATALVGRGLDRADALATRLAFARSGAMTERIMGLLWQLGETRGRVVPDGTLVDMPLPATLLAEMLPGSRSRVSSALTALAVEGRISRRPASRLLICAHRPAALRHLSAIAPWICALGNTLNVGGVS